MIELKPKALDTIYQYLLLSCTGSIWAVKLLCLQSLTKI